MKKSTWIRLHLYCGLFTSFYLIAFGVSSLILNHNMKVENNDVTTSWTGQVQVDPTQQDQALAESLRDQLGLMGWVPPWQFKKDSTHFKCTVTHLAKNTDLQVDLQTGLVQVNERPKGLLAVIHGLHFFNGRIPNALFFLRTWIVYQWLTLLVLLCSLVLGLWLWIRYSHRSWELYVFGGVFLISCLLMFAL